MAAAYRHRQVPLPVLGTTPGMTGWRRTCADLIPSGVGGLRRVGRANARLVASLSAAATFLATWAWIAFVPLAYLDPEYPAWRAKSALLDRCDIGEVVILGDSRAAVDVIPALLPVPATNLAVGGGKPVEAWSALKRVLACPTPPRRVLLALDPAHFMKLDLFWERGVRFGFISPDDLRELAALSRATGDARLLSPASPDGLPASLRVHLYAIRFPTLYFNSLLRGGVFLRWWPNHNRLVAALESRGQYFFGTGHGADAVALDGHLDAFSPSPVLDRYFDMILQRLAERGIPVDFIAMPVNRSTDREIKPALRQGFTAYLAGYQARYPGFHVVGEAMRHWPDALFGDVFSHLNPEGAMRFSQWLGDCLGQRLAEQACTEPDAQARLQAAPPSTQNDAQYGWFNATGRDASARVRPSSKPGA